MATTYTVSTPRSMAPGASVAPGSFHDGAAASSHGSAASAFNNTRSTAPYLANHNTVQSPSAHAAGTGAYEVSGLPATPGTQHTPISTIVNKAASVFSPVGPAGAGYFLPGGGGLFTPGTGGGLAGGSLVGGSPQLSHLVGRIPDNVHVNPPTAPAQPPANSGGSQSGGSSGGTTSPQDTLDSSQLGNLLYDLLGPASTGVTPGDAGMQVTPVSPTTTTSSPNVLVGLLALGVLAGIGWYYLKERKKGAHGESH